MMTPRERVLAVLNGKRPDKIPFTIYENKIPQCSVERDLRNDGLCLVNRDVPAFKIETPNCVMEEFSYTEGGRRRIRSVTRTPVGEVSSVREPAGFTFWTLEKLFKGPDDYKVLKFIARDSTPRPCYEEYLEAEEQMGDDIILRPLLALTPLHEIMIMMMGVETFAEEWSRRRDEILELESAMRQVHSRIYRLLADSPITHANYGGNETSEVMGPPRFKEFVIPLYDACAAVFHEKGKLLGTHLDGNNRAWADAVADSALDYVEAFTPAPDTDMTLQEALDAWHDKVIWINFPSSVHLASLDKIKETTREIISLANETNRVILGITEDIPKDRWQKNLLAISEVINES